MKFKEELANEKNPTIIRIGEYLAKRAETDPSVARSLAKENKSLAECYVYVRNQAKKQAINGCACVDDETVFGWAVHYYDEDDIKESKHDIQKEKEKKEEYGKLSKTSTDTISSTFEPQKKKKAPNTHKKGNGPVEGQISLF